MRRALRALTASRTAFAYAGLGCLALAFALAPSRARSQLEAVTPLIAPTPIVTPDAPIAPLVPRRDPFVPPLEATPLAALPDLPIGALPPNAGAGAFPLASAVPQRAGARLIALAFGPHPTALVVVAGQTRLVRAGDRLGTSTVRSIDDAGLALGDGSVMRLDGTAER